MKCLSNEDIKKYVEYILNSLQLSGEYKQALGLLKRVLLVEGVTDVAFIEHIVADGTVCKSISELLIPRLAFSSKEETESINYKEIIKSILLRLSKDPTFFDFPVGAEKWPLYGMVDNDFENPIGVEAIKKLFFTGTHDIETLMLSTDDGLIDRLSCCKISQDEVRIAYYLSYQLAYYRQAIYNVDREFAKFINEADGTVNYSQFVDDYHIIVEKLFAVIQEHIPNEVSKEKLKKSRGRVIANLKNKLNKGVWKQPLDTFAINQKDDFWQMTNGHDILSAIKYVNESADKVFRSAGGFGQNRSFELALSDAYDYHCFTKTELYKNLLDAQLIVPCS